MKGIERRFNILVVEDNLGDFVLIEDYLEEANIARKLYKAEDFKSAREILTVENNDIDIILLDLTLPDMRGEALLKETQLLSQNKPIVILTGYSDSGFAVKSLALGASDYLLKDLLNSTVLHKSVLYNIERNRILVNLRNSEQRYSDLFHFSPLPMWVYDTETLRFLDVNDAAIEHYGYSYDEFLNMDITQIRPEADIPILMETIEANKVSEKNFYNGEFTHIKKNKEHIRVEIRSNSFEYKGRLAKIILVNDVTERNSYIDAIEKQNSLLREIAWTQSHVVRAPLARLMGLVNMLQNEKITEDQKEDFYGYIQKSAQELDEIIKGVVHKSQQIEVKKDQK